MTTQTKPATFSLTGDSARHNQPPTRISFAIFQIKATLLRCRRAIVDLLRQVHRHPQAPRELFPYRISSSSTPLWTDPNRSEAWYQLGKVKNLALAAQCLDGCSIPPKHVFSFWKQVGRASARRGFVPGRMLLEGCMVPAIGGGLCQLSNAVYQVALDAGCTIVERHAHSRIVPGSATYAGRDATVAWNYIDLRFQSVHRLQLRADLTQTHLHVSIWSDEPLKTTAPAPQSSPLAVLPVGDEHACDTCGNQNCFRHPF